jgi:hypothetical protein
MTSLLYVMLVCTVTGSIFLLFSVSYLALRNKQLIRENQTLLDYRIQFLALRQMMQEEKMRDFRFLREAFPAFKDYINAWEQVYDVLNEVDQSKAENQLKEKRQAIADACHFHFTRVEDI